MNETAQQNMENHPVIRTLYDHVDEVTCLAFHPTEQILASGSRDYTLKLFDYSKPSAKRAFKYIQVRNVWKEALLFFFLKYDELLCDYSLLKSSLCDHPRKEYGSWDGGARGSHFIGTWFSCCHAPTSTSQSGCFGLQFTQQGFRIYYPLEVARSLIKDKTQQASPKYNVNRNYSVETIS